MTKTWDFSSQVQSYDSTIGRTLFRHTFDDMLSLFVQLRSDGCCIACGRYCDHCCSEVGKFTVVVIADDVVSAIINIAFVADTAVIVVVDIDVNLDVVICKSQ